MMTFKSVSNKFSSVAADVATASSCANNIVALGAALAVPFFVAITIICIIMNILDFAITLIALIIIKNLICICKSSKRIKAV